MNPILNTRHRHKTEAQMRGEMRFNSSTALRGSSAPAVPPKKPFSNGNPQQGTGNSTQPLLFISSVPQGAVGEIFPFY